MQDLIDQFLRTYQGRLKPSTFSDYRSILAHHLKPFGTLEALNLGLEEYLAGLVVTGKRKNNILSAARTFVAWAQRRRLWRGELYRVPRFPYRRGKIPPLAPDEAQLVMNYSPLPYRDFFVVSILTGLRTGEALGLRWEDFDLERRLIMVRRALSCGQVVATKTVSGEREVQLLRPVWEIYRRRGLENCGGSPWFFYGAQRGIMSRSALRRTWHSVLEVFEIEARPLYATRHTFASLAMAAGEDPLWIARAMGHSRPDQLFLAYASYLEGVKRDGEKFLDLVGKKTLLQAVT